MAATNSQSHRPARAQIASEVVLAETPLSVGRSATSRIVCSASISSLPVGSSNHRLSEKIAVAGLDFMLGPLLENPQRIGIALRGELAKLFSACVGAYRVVYEISEVDTTVRVVYIDHRADVYRPR
jgi:mRNA-degrading endonuclease RelE of RelBE toxin-antitoxin system